MKNHYCCMFLIILAVILNSIVAFKIPGLSSYGSSSRTPSGSKGHNPGQSGNNHKAGTEGEYMGPVFIIRELDKEKGEYDAFVTTGGIQEVRGQSPHVGQSQPPANGGYNGYGGYGGQSQPPTNGADTGGQQQQHGKPTADDEDTKYFGVLVTPDTVRQLNMSKTSAINVPLSVLLVAVSSRMPWLLVLHRKNYPYLFESAEVPVQQNAPAAGTIPNMQIPQRRRHYSSERQRRGLAFSDGGASGVVPLAFERELMSTMCYNFFRETSPLDAGVNRAVLGGQTTAVDYDYDDENARGRHEIVFDANAYAREAAVRSVQNPSAVSAGTQQPSDVDDQTAKMTIPKRVS